MASASVVTPVPGAPASAPVAPRLPLLGPGSEQRPGAIWPPPGDGWQPPPCQLETVTSVTRRGNAYEVVAALRNVTQATIEVDAPDRCPQGPAVFSGLGEGFDYYGSCTRGSCAGGRAPIHFSIPPGKTVEIAAASIDPVHGGCGHSSLSPGRYTLSFGVQTQQRLCGGAMGTLDYRSQAVTPKPKPKPRRTRPCPPQPACGLACPGGYLEDPEGCSSCACAPDHVGIVPEPTGR